MKPFNQEQQAYTRDALVIDDTVQRGMNLNICNNNYRKKINDMLPYLTWGEF